MSAVSAVLKEPSNQSAPACKGRFNSQNEATPRALCNGLPILYEAVEQRAAPPVVPRPPSSSRRVVESSSRIQYSTVHAYISAHHSPPPLLPASVASPKPISRCPSPSIDSDSILRCIILLSFITRSTNTVALFLLLCLARLRLPPSTPASSMLAPHSPFAPARMSVKVPV